MPRFILASGSPRRRELLASLIPQFEVVVADVDEDALTVDDPHQTARELSQAKARKVFETHPDAIVIAGDTVVALRQPDCSWKQLSKPTSAEDAVGMLTRLSGKEHVVITGVCVLSSSGELADCETTQVRFRALSDEEIRAYVATGEPMDKAGGYAIQGGAKSFVESTVGSITNVVGLPLDLLRALLDKIGV